MQPEHPVARLDDSAGREAFGRLGVTRFRGKCLGDVPQLQRRGPKTLGLTHVAEGEILPFSELDCDRVRNFVQPKLARKNRLRADQLLGRALGRVLAHELYHMLAKTAAHGLSGIATATLTAEELVGGQPRLHAEQSEGIRRSLLEAGLPAITASAAR